MNSKNAEQHESLSISKKSKKEKNSNPDVLIIPPNLLEKFGFTLGGIHTLNENVAQGGSKINSKISNLKYCNPKSNEDRSVVVNDEHINVNKEMSINKETSILETATLMKESVFLSPTFVPMVANIIPGELEITSASEKVCNMNQIELITLSQKDIVTVSTHDSKLSIETNECKNESFAPQENLEKGKNIALSNIHDTSFNSCNEVMKEKTIVQSDQVIENKEFHHSLQSSNDNFLGIVENETSVESLQSIDINNEKKIIEDFVPECAHPKIDIISQSINITSCDSRMKSQNNKGIGNNLDNDNIIKKMNQQHEVTDLAHSFSDVIVTQEINHQCVKSNQECGSTRSIFALNDDDLDSAKITVVNALPPYVQSNKEEGYLENILVSSVPFDRNLINVISADTSSATKNICQNEMVGEEKHWQCTQSKVNHGSLENMSISVPIDGSFINGNSNPIKNINENEIVGDEKYLQCVQTNEDQGTHENVLVKDIYFDGNTINTKSVVKCNLTKTIGGNLIVWEKAVPQCVHTNEDQGALENILASGVILDTNLTNVESIDNFNPIKNINISERLSEEKHLQSDQSYEDQGSPAKILDNNCSFDGNLINTKSIKNLNPTKNIDENEKEELKNLQCMQTNEELGALDNIPGTSATLDENTKNVKSVDIFNPNKIINNNESKLKVREEKYLHCGDEAEACLDNITSIPFEGHLLNVNSIDNLDQTKNIDEVICKEKPLKFVQSNAYQESADNIISNNVNFDEHSINTQSAVGNSYSDEKGTKENEFSEANLVIGDICESKKDDHLALNSCESKTKSEFKSQKKIKIISEEIVNYKLLHDHKITKSSHINNLILVTMDSLVSLKAKDNENSVITDKVKTPQFDVVIDDHSNELSHGLKISNSTSNDLWKSKPEATFNKICRLPSIECFTKIDLNGGEECVSDMCNEGSPSNKNIDYIPNVENNTHTMNNNNIDNANNNESGNTEIGSNQSSPQVLRKTSVNEDIDLIESHRDKNQSKHIQKIEKCGNNMEFKAFSTCIKTYKPKRSNCANKPVINFKNRSEESVTLHNENSIIINDGTHFDTTLDNVEYLCHNFGKLIHCDLTDTESIQLVHSNTECCDPNIIYEIYYDKTLFETQQYLDVPENMSCENKMVNICWNDSDSNNILPDIDLFPTTSIAKENVDVIIKADVDEKGGSYLLTQYNNFHKTNSPAQSPKNEVISVEDYNTSGNLTIIEVPTKLNENMNATNAIPAQNSVETANDKNNTETIKVDVNSAANASMVLIENQYNNNNTLIHNMAHNVESPNKSELMSKIKFTNHKKDYSCIGRASKRNFDSIDSSSECMEKKRCISQSNSPETPSTDTKRLKLGKITCGICRSVLDDEDWEKHVYCTHLKLNITKRKDLQSEECHEYLNEKLKMFGILQCHFCCFRVNHVPTFVLHIEDCVQKMTCKNRIVLSNQDSINTITCGVCKEIVKSKFWTDHIRKHNYLAQKEGKHELSDKNRIVSSNQGSIKTITCGVCKEIVKSKFWTDHIRKHHHYLAWKEGEDELNFKNEQAILEHLRDISIKMGTLLCNCGYRHKFAKLYLTHIMNCSIKIARNSPKQNDSPIRDNDIQCEVCQSYVDPKNWIDHIQQEHNYLAWKTGEMPLNFGNNREVLKHLKAIITSTKDLVCAKCGLTRKSANSYLSHINKCEGKPFQNEGDSTTLDTSQLVSCKIEEKDLSPNGTSTDLVSSTVELSYRKFDSARYILFRDYGKTKDHESCATDCDTNTILDSSQLNSNETESKDLNPRRTSKRARLASSIDESQAAEGDSTLDSSQLVSSKTDLSLHESSKRARLETVSSDLEDNENVLSLSERKFITCGVCSQTFSGKDWAKHIQIEHYYLAWKDGQLPLDLQNEECVRKHLYTISRKLHGLSCSKCDFKHKYVKCYLEHIQECTGKDLLSSNDTVLTESNEGPTKSPSKMQCNIVKCGVCQNEIGSRHWIKHLRNTHKYLAWKEGESHVNFDDMAELNQHLNKLVDTLGELICSKCKCVQKHVESYLEHIKACGETNEVKSEVKNENENICEDVPDTGPINDKIVKCAVCNQEIQESLWINHIENEHNYLAWRHGETELDLDDVEAVRIHLYTLSKKLNGLTCANCKLVRRYVKSYLEHIKNCGRTSMDISVDVSIEKYSEPTQSSVGPISSVPTEDKIVNSGVCRSHEAIAKKYRQPQNEVKIEVKNENENICEDVPDTGPINDKIVKCAVCYQDIKESLWINHIENEHNYLAWKHGETKLDLDDVEAVRLHLYTLSKKLNGLTCANCKLVRRYVKSYLEHIKNCGRTSMDISVDDLPSSNDTVLPESNEEPTKSSSKMQSKMVKCGVCQKEIRSKRWIKHLRNTHEYLAWKEGESQVNFDNMAELKQHLNKLVETLGELICSKCKCVQKHVESYLEHIEACEETNEVKNKNENICEDVPDSGPITDKIVKCAVCNQEIQESLWINHIESEHNYLAWKHGETKLDLDDVEAVRLHLYTLSKKLNGLTCANCKLVRRYVKSYLEHIKNCGRTSMDISVDVCIEKYTEPTQSSVGPMSSVPTEDKVVNCGVCRQEMQKSHWIQHIAEKHNYMAWIEGEPVLDFKDELVIRQHLQQLSNELNGLVCSKCNLVRKHVKKFLLHIDICDGTQPVANSDDKLIKCGVCGVEMKNETWYTHIGKNHNYLAWIDGESPLDLENDEGVRHYLRQISSKLGGLVCSNCDYVRKNVNNFLEHIKVCDGTNPMKSDNKQRKPDKLVKCGVCGLLMQKGLWYTHIEESHNYLAWKDGKPALDLEDEESIRNHLYNLSKKLRGLNCSKCGTKRKYVKSYLEHIKNCTAQVDDSEDEVNLSVLKDTNDLSAKNEIIKCGVCSKEVPTSQWIKHIQVTHNYIAWRDDEEPIDLENDDSIRTHLYKILRLVPTLLCPYCGITKRKAEYYHDHMKICNTPGEVCEDKTTLLSKNDGMYECGICHENVTPNKWENHAMNNHYNVTWVVGEVPINLKNPYGIEKCLKKYVEKTGKMICKNCGAKRASLMGFFVHVITCGKSDEETAMYKEECGICHKLYLGVYRNQHMAYHKTQQVASVRKIVKDEKDDENHDSKVVTGRRKAAEKANQVIQKYKKNGYDKTCDFNCENCDFGCDTKEELSLHKCKLDADEQIHSDADIASSSEDYLSEVSDDLIETERKPKSIRKSLKYKSINGNPYLSNTITDFRSLHLSEENLFLEWLSPSYDCIDCEDIINKYMPKLEQSCQVNINSEWTTYSRFEGRYQKEVYSMFVGGSIQCISWAPHNNEVNSLENNYLAVVSHLGSDLPRYQRNDLAQHTGLIQIWDMRNFQSVAPKLALGLVHDYGTVWAMDWCPSGAREVFDPNSEQNGVSRLGLLAIACSNGSAYILCVPNPESMPKSEENIFLKLKPVAELRFTMKSNTRRYQATSLSWSKKKGHPVVVVGYADGHIALFDLKNISPLLRSSENDLTVFYPYHDERLLNSSISALDTFPALGEGVTDAVCGASSVGAVAIPVMGGRRMMSRLPSSFAAFTPAWPVAIIGADDGVVSQSPYDMEWHGCGRRLGALRASAGCYQCGCMLIYTPPLLRTARLYTDFVKTVVASVNVKKLKLKKKSKVEPLKYEDAIKQYGVEFSLAGANFKPGSGTKEPYPERFPLADVTSLAYCPSGKCHEMAAVATHAGLIFIFNAR